MREKECESEREKKKERASSIKGMIGKERILNDRQKKIGARGETEGGKESCCCHHALRARLNDLTRCARMFTLHCVLLGQMCVARRANSFFPN